MRYNRWEDVNELREDQSKILFGLKCSAGFQAIICNNLKQDMLPHHNKGVIGFGESRFERLY